MSIVILTLFQIEVFIYHNWLARKSSGQFNCKLWFSVAPSHTCSFQDKPKFDYVPISLLNIITSVLADWTEGLLSQVDHHQGKTVKEGEGSGHRAAVHEGKAEILETGIPWVSLCRVPKRHLTLTPRETACPLVNWKVVIKLISTLMTQRRLNKRTSAIPQKKTFRRKNWKKKGWSRNSDLKASI